MSPVNGTGSVVSLSVTLSGLESSMSSVQIEQKSYEMPPKEGLSIAHFLTVGDINRSLDYYEKVFGARILGRGDGNAPGYLQFANIWMIPERGGRADLRTSRRYRSASPTRITSTAS